MKAIVVMFDTLNRHMLPPYGCTWTKMPNFQRLAQRTAVFDRSYVCSMPCMPARRDFHTGRPNFLHRSWGPIEPFDDSMPQMLKEAGVYTHLTTDHHHYFEDGGSTYHHRYSTWQYNRGQEGDKWMGQIADPAIPESILPSKDKLSWRQDWINRSFMPTDAQHYQTQTFADGLDFIERNHDEDPWMLNIETFDPHEPFFSHREWKDHYAEHFEKYRDVNFDWPPYRYVKESPEQVEHMIYEYAALMTKCDAHLGAVLDRMDQYNLWDDTMLVVWTDHGFLMGEHEMYAKVWTPFYQEIAHTPFFMWDPRSGTMDQHRQALVQPSIDLPVTLLGYFGLSPTPDMLGKDLAETISTDQPQREAAIFGIHGGHVNITDGRYVYMRSPSSENNNPLYEYTLMPTHMTQRFKPEELRDNIELADPFSFTKGCRTMKIRIDRLPYDGRWKPFETALFDVANDPKQQNPINDAEIEKRLVEQMVKLMGESDSPPEQYERLGL